MGCRRAEARANPLAPQKRLQLKGKASNTIAGREKSGEKAAAIPVHNAAA